MKKTLVDIFDESRVADEIRHLVDNAYVINGANEFYRSQEDITKEVSSGKAIYEWKVQGNESLVLMSEKHAKPLLDIINIPLEESRMQYPTEELVKARAGDIALGMTKENSPMVVVMQKALVMENLDPLLRHEKEMGDVIDRLQRFMKDNYLQSSDVVKFFDDLEISHNSMVHYSSHNND